MARAEQLEEEESAPPAPAVAFEAPEARPVASGKQRLETLSPEELESLKQEVVEEVVTKIAGEDNERLENFMEPEV